FIQTCLVTVLNGRIAAGESIAANAIRCDVQRFRIAWIERQIHATSVIIDVHDVPPSLAGGVLLEHAALNIRSPSMAKGSDVEDVGVAWMDDNAANMRPFLQAHVGPRLAAVARFVDAVAPRDAVARVGRPGADPNDVRV